MAADLGKRLRPWAWIALVGFHGCHGCGSIDYPVSSPPGDSAGAHRSFAQSETTMVRIDQLGDRPEGEPAARYLSAYNDDTSAIMDATDGTCFRFAPARPTLDGWASSDAFGGDWVRHEQLPVSSALQKQGVQARHGDPWLAAWSSRDFAAPGIVLYVSVAQGSLASRQGPWFLLLSRSHDNGKSFEDPFVLLGPQGDIPDGPKVAITGEGTSALVVWNQFGQPGVPSRIVWNLDANLTASATALLDPVAIGDPPDPSCRFSGAAAHPRVAAGRSTFYVAALVSYTCSAGPKQRLEVYRNPAIGIAFGAPWERILSAAPPPSVTSAGFGILNVQDANGTPRFGTRIDRGSSLPSLAVGQAADGEFVIAADLQVQAGTLPDEAQREKVILFRLAKADSCDARDHRGDLDSCGSAVAGQEIDTLAKPNGMQTVSSRAGIWESKPALFTGKVPDGTVDRRVGLIWYSQPYKGRMSVTDEMRARTIVEAAVSTDGGLTFQGPFNLSAARPDDGGPPEDPNIGAYFYPCQILCSGYYGEYLSGAFQFADASPTAIVGTWGDSREGCTSQSLMTRHHHVWAGAVRPQ